MLMLKLQYFGRLMGRADLLGKKTPSAGKDWGQEQKGTREDEVVGWHHRLDRSLSKLWEMVKDRKAWHAAVYGVTDLDMTRTKTMTNEIMTQQASPADFKAVRQRPQGTWISMVSTGWWKGEPAAAWRRNQAASCMHHCFVLASWQPNSRTPSELCHIPAMFSCQK